MVPPLWQINVAVQVLVFWHQTSRTEQKRLNTPQMTLLVSNCEARLRTLLTRMLMCDKCNSNESM